MAAPVLTGAEPFSSPGGPDGVLVLHGFTGSPSSVRALAEAMVGEGHGVELPLLPGHGTAVEDLVPMRWSDWTDAADAAYAELAGRSRSVAVVGLSMGGTLACWLAERYPDIAGLVLVNPVISPPGPELRAGIEELVAGGTTVAPGIGSDIAHPDAVELAYEGTPLEGVLSLFAGAEEVAERLDRIRCPVLLLTSREDHVVPPGSGDLMVATIGGTAERVWLERSYHVATLDYDAPEIESRTVAFVRRVLGAPKG